MTWKRDGEEMQEDVDVGETLPNGDGTYQKRAVLTVSPEQRTRSQYTCEVEHAGVLIIKTLTVPGRSLGEMAEMYILTHYSVCCCFLLCLRDSR